MEISPKRAKAQALMDHFIMALMQAAMEANIEVNWLVQPMLQKAAHLAAASAMIGKPVDVDGMLKNFPLDVSESTKAILAKVN